MVLHDSISGAPWLQLCGSILILKLYNHLYDPIDNDGAL